MTPEELRLLKSYQAGPRIWDATAILPHVYALEVKGLIEPDDSGTYHLTDSGRKVLRAADKNRHEYKPDHSRAWDPCERCGHGRNHPWHLGEES
jgi:hypothetical protein